MSSTDRTDGHGGAKAYSTGFRYSLIGSCDSRCGESVPAPQHTRVAVQAQGEADEQLNAMSSTEACEDLRQADAGFAIDEQLVPAPQVAA